MCGLGFEIRFGYDDVESVQSLFSEYIDLLIEVESDFGAYLQIQDYESEISDLRGKYGLPGGRLYVMYYDGQAAGCIALRRMSDLECEMKRLFVLPRFRNLGIAKALVELIISDARDIGYKSMLLDTLPGLADAILMYEKAGFYRIPQYNDSPLENTVFMRLDL